MANKSIIILSALLVLLSACTKEPGSNGGGSTPVKPKGAITISGSVKDASGNGLSGVVVSDGFKCCTTATSGRYELDSDLSKAKFVFVSIPEGYHPSVVNGIPVFYRRLAAEKKTGDAYLNQDFTVTRNTQSGWNIVIAADVQPRAKSETWDNFAYHSLDVAEDFYTDVAAWTKTQSGNVCGIMLGDIVHENMSLFTNYCNGLKKMNIPFYNVIGNHDYDLSKADDIQGAESYEKALGPTNYSFNLGGFHFVMLDNIIMKSSAGKLNKKYSEGLTDDIWEWLKSDLELVSKNTPLMVCAHAPLIASNGGGKRYTTATHGNDYAVLFSQFKKVYTWGGHTHQSYNNDGSTMTYKNIETHTVTRCCGELWNNDWLNHDGLPRGYVVATLNSGTICWRYKPLTTDTAQPVTTRLPAYDRKYGGDNVRAYPKGLYGDNYVYANVYLWDESFKSVKFVTSTKTVTMTRVQDSNYTWDYSWKELYDFYKTNISQYQSESTYPFDNSCYHLFRVYVSEKSASGHVEVVDRFNNTHISNEISW